MEVGKLLVGVPMAIARGDTAESFLKNADQALYEAKRAGRNVAVSYP